jgi:hypothetical protein
MIFEIDFKKNSNNTFLIEKLGAKLEQFNRYNRFTLEIKNFNSLKNLLKKVNEELNQPAYKEYVATISFDPPTIYLDCCDI